MPKKIDLTGQRFGKLVVVKESPERKSGRIYWECKCDCGNIILVKGLSLKNGDTKSCGCLRAGNEIGKRYGKWTVIDKGPSLGRRARWLCECDCGARELVLASNLRSGASQSCGCQTRDNLIGQKFGNLTVIATNDVRNNEHVCWDCICECGNKTIVEGYNLKSGALNPVDVREVLQEKKEYNNFQKIIKLALLKNIGLKLMVRIDATILL